jgi:hypothetical protein
MKTATTAQVNASLLRMDPGASALLLGVLVQRVSGRTWRIAGSREQMLLCAIDALMRHAGHAGSRALPSPIVDVPLLFPETCGA